jgi:hypothetical protein
MTGWLAAEKVMAAQGALLDLDEDVDHLSKGLATMKTTSPIAHLAGTVRKA